MYIKCNILKCTDYKVCACKDKNHKKDFIFEKKDNKKENKLVRTCTDVTGFAGLLHFLSENTKKLKKYKAKFICKHKEYWHLLQLVE